MLKIRLALSIHREIINRYFLRMWDKNGLVLYACSCGSQEAEGKRRDLYFRPGWQTTGP